LVTITTPTRLISIWRRKSSIRKREQRTRDRDARIVDQAEQPLAGEFIAHAHGGRVHPHLIGHVEDQGHKALAELRRQSFGVGGLAHAAENAKAIPDQDFCDTPADAGGRARDNNAAHANLPILDLAIDPPARNSNGAADCEAQSALAGE
jgi:hypothetical protein